MVALGRRQPSYFEGSGGPWRKAPARSAHARPRERDSASRGRASAGGFFATALTRQALNARGGDPQLPCAAGCLEPSTPGCDAPQAFARRPATAAVRRRLLHGSGWGQRIPRHIKPESTTSREFGPPSPSPTAAIWSKHYRNEPTARTITARYARPSITRRWSAPILHAKARHVIQGIRAVRQVDMGPLLRRCQRLRATQSRIGTRHRLLRRLSRTSQQTHRGGESTIVNVSTSTGRFPPKSSRRRAQSRRALTNPSSSPSRSPSR